MQRRTFICALGAATVARPVFTAEPYPSKPIRVIVPYPAGGVVDVQARVLTERLAEELKQPFVVEARPGASGNIAAEAVANAAADGYTLLVSASFLVTGPMLEPKQRWATKDLVAVGRFAQSPAYFVVPMNSPARSVKEFVELAKKASAPLPFGDGGIGTPQTVAIDIFSSLAGIRLDPIRYKGSPYALADLINGVLAMMVLPSSVAIPQIKGGKLRALATVSNRRSPQLPDIPTIGEVGYPDAAVLSWYGLHAPAGTPADVIQKLESAMKAATASSTVKERLAGAGGEEAFLGTRDFVAFLQADAQRMEKLLQTIRK